MNIQEARRGIDAEVREILRLDQYWNKCYPCRQGGVCCRGANVLALLPELADIHDLLENTPETKSYALQQILLGRDCIFYREDAQSCLVHDRRPLLCRLTPFKGLSGKGEITVFVEGSGGCRDFAMRTLPVESRDGRYVRAGGRVYFDIRNLFSSGGKHPNELTSNVRSYFEKIYSHPPGSA